MAKSVGIIVRRGPYGTINAAEAVRHAAGGINFNLATTLILLEDGVYVARRDQDGERQGFTSLAGPVARFVQQEGCAADGAILRGRVVVHGPSLAARGLRQDQLVGGVELVDDAALARLVGSCDAVLAY